MKKNHQPVILVSLDGWGVAPASRGNAITLANTPVFKELLKNYPHCTIQASGESVGLPWQEMGNSEVGHMNMGSGRILYQDLPKINKIINDGSFFSNPSFLKVANHVKKNNSRLQIMGLLSPGGVHSHMNHLFALLEFCKQQKITKVFLHLFSDGRDTPPANVYQYLAELNNQIEKIGVGKIASIAGRFYAMDRDRRWDRTKKTYQAIVNGIGKTAETAEEAIRQSYQVKIFDEEIEPTVINDKNGPVATINDNDGVIFFNYRADRARQLTKAVILPGFDNFERGERLKNIVFVTLTEYDVNLPVEIAFPNEAVNNSLGEVISNHGLKQFRVAETEKYAHVTFFFNCGQIDPFKGEERQLISSPLVAHYNDVPEMSAIPLTDLTIRALTSNKYQFILLNFANADMVGHTGDLEAGIKAIELIDAQLGRLLEVVLDLKWVMIITADHGNCEVMRDLQTGEINKEHTANPVPFIILSDKKRKTSLTEDPDLSIEAPYGVLGDVAPTVLEIMNIKKPAEMTGISLYNILGNVNS